jgi:hypothetical protein
MAECDRGKMKIIIKQVPSYKQVDGQWVEGLHRPPIWKVYDDDAPLDDKRRCLTFDDEKKARREFENWKSKETR